MGNILLVNFHYFHVDDVDEKKQIGNNPFTVIDQYCSYRIKKYLVNLLP